MSHATSQCPCSKCKKKLNPNACSVTMTPVCKGCGPVAADEKCEELTPACPYVCCPVPCGKPKCSQNKPCLTVKKSKNV